MAKYLELKVPPLMLMVVIGFLMIIGSGLLPDVDIYDWVRVPLFVLVLSAGAIFCFMGVREFRKCKTTVDPRYPEKASMLVDSGIYKVSRNPMYVGFALLLVSIVIFLASPVLLLGVWVFVAYMNRFQIVPEETILTTTFGEQYTGYRQQVRRWL